MDEQNLESKNLTKWNIGYIFCLKETLSPLFSLKGNIKSFIFNRTI